MALSDLMPYGAPEMLEGARARMASSTFVASFLVAGLVLGAGLLAARFAPPPAVPSIGDFTRRVDLLPPIETFQADAGPTAPRTTTDFGTPVLVRDLEPDATDIAPNLAPDLPGTLPGQGETREVAGGSRGTPEAAPPDPAPGKYVAVDQLPDPVREPQPRYPDFARDLGLEGEVHVLMLVGLDGRVQRAIVAPGGRASAFDEAALAAANATVFTPALANGHPVKVWVGRSYRFRLR